VHLGRMTNCSACHNVRCAGVRIARCCTRGLSIKYSIARLVCGDAGNAPAVGSDISIPVRHRTRSISRIQNTIRRSPRNRAPTMASWVLRGEFGDVSLTAIPIGDLGPVASLHPDWGRPSYRGSGRSNCCWIGGSVICRKARRGRGGSSTSDAGTALSFRQRRPAAGM
jgi:hypothetical protein